MAAVSPIVVNSSSPNSFRIPSITPPSLQRSSTKLISSSPGLASPSTFVKPRAPGLKSGSRAAQVPEDGHRGFASAASLWRLNQFGKEPIHDDEKDVRKAERKGRAAKGSETKSNATTGKLVKPKKVAKKQESAELTRKESPGMKLGDFSYHDITRAESKSPSKVVSPQIANAGSDCPARPPAPARKHSISLSEFEFDVAKQDRNIQPPKRPSTEPKKSRKRPAKAGDGSNELPIKKPRKQKKKSESIIQNSDEPEADDAPASGPTKDAQQQQRVSEQPAVQDELKTKTKTVSPRRPKVKKAAPGILPLDPPTPLVQPMQNHDKEKHGDASATEQSVYFGKLPAVGVDQPKGLTTESPGTKITTITDDIATDMQDTTIAQVASRRRLSWTPVKNTTVATMPNSRPQTAGSEASDTSHTPKLQLTDLLPGFGYVSTDGGSAMASERTVTGEAATKRRRIELAAPANAVAATRIEPPCLDVQKPAKRPKAPKKKAQTITALATAAFQPAKDPNLEESAVSEFFAPRKSEASHPQALLEKPQPTTMKPKKPRKSRAKAALADGQGAPAKPKRTSKANTTKVKYNEGDYVAKLYSPARASAQLKNQDFLFSTSSQITADESPSFIRDMQAALRESELMPKVGPDGVGASQTVASPKWKSYVSVPTAPHGTCLSVEQAEKELWCVSSRDFKGGIWRSQKLRFQTARSVDAEDNGEQTARAEPTAAQPDSVEEVSGPQQVIVDLCDTSPAAPVMEADSLGVPSGKPDDIIVEGQQAEILQETDSLTGLRAGDDKEDDSWMLLQSDDAEPVAGPSAVLPDRTSPVAARGTPSKVVLGPPKFLSSSRLRPPLSPLNPNATMCLDTIPDKATTFTQNRPFSSNAAHQARTSSRSPTRRPPGRPRKDAAAVSPTQLSPKRRGRPPKPTTLVSDPSPRLLKPKRRKAEASASQPAPRTEWLDIDEISDSDSPTTPSPPRRRATSSPPAVQPLPLVATGPPSIKAKAPALAAPAAPALKAGDPSWLLVRETLFPGITAMIKSAPRSTDPSRPTWWEKILLYDPIVLEDLTIWLNEQGLRFEIKRQKPKPKKKGRKRKDAEVEPDEVEWEIHEELKPWMVQKWCEEKSICCLWKEGLRGGVRTRY